ncbi:MAG: SH3 domain-containing protein [Bacteriovoracia bacterium]
MRSALLVLLFSVSAWAQDKAVGVFYFTPILGHVHQSPARTSPSLTTIQCGHPLKVIEDSKVIIGEEWSLVSVADWKGFVWKKHLATKKPDCIQSRYPKFFDGLSLDLAELYYWGRLHDHWTEGQVRP